MPGINTLAYATFSTFSTFYVFYVLATLSYILATLSYVFATFLLRFGWKGLPGTNTLAYYGSETNKYTPIRLMCQSLIHDILFFRIQSAKNKHKRRSEIKHQNHHFSKVSFFKLIFAQAFFKKGVICQVRGICHV